MNIFKRDWMIRLLSCKLTHESVFTLFTILMRLLYSVTRIWIFRFLTTTFFVRFFLFFLFIIIICMVFRFFTSPHPPILLLFEFFFSFFHSHFLCSFLRKTFFKRNLRRILEQASTHFFSLSSCHVTTIACTLQGMTRKNQLKRRINDGTEQKKWEI